MAPFYWIVATVIAAVILVAIVSDRLSPRVAVPLQLVTLALGYGTIIFVASAAIAWH